MALLCSVYVVQPCRDLVQGFPALEQFGKFGQSKSLMVVICRVVLLGDEIILL